MARKLSGRSDNEIKNHWHTHLKKRLHNKQDPAPVTTPMESNKQVNETVKSGPADQLDLHPSKNSQEPQVPQDQKQLQHQNIHDAVAEITSLHSQETSCSTELSSTLTSSQSFEEPLENFWDDELLFEGAIYGGNGNSYSLSEYEEGLFMSSNSSTMEEDYCTLPYSLFYDDINFFNNFMQ